MSKCMDIYNIKYLLISLIHVPETQITNVVSIGVTVGTVLSSQVPCINSGFVAVAIMGLSQTPAENRYLHGLRTVRPASFALHNTPFIFWKTDPESGVSCFLRLSSTQLRA